MPSTWNVDEIVAAHARHPRAVDLRDRRRLRARTSRRRRRRRWRRSGCPRSSQRCGMCVAPRHEHALHRAEQVVEHVAPVAEHVDDDAAVVLLAVVPRRPLRRLPVALEHPVAELAAHRQDAAEEARVDQHPELQQARQPELVLHDAVLDARGLGAPVEVERLGAPSARPASRCRCACRRRSPCGSARDAAPSTPSRSRRRRRGRRAPRRGRWSSAATPCARASASSLSALRPTRIGSGMHAPAVGERDAALGADRADRADEVLVGAHAPGDAVHDDAEAFGFHGEVSLEAWRGATGCAGPVPGGSSRAGTASAPGQSGPWRR